MPSSFIRKHVRGLLRGKFSPSTSMESSSPEVYCGKTGLDIPCIGLEDLESDVFATYSGPDGGLTQVGQVRVEGMVRMANIDDEMSLSIGGCSDCESEEVDEEATSEQTSSQYKEERATYLGSCSSLIGPNDLREVSPRRGADQFEWNRHDDERAFGVSVSLYERNPLTGVNAGNPIADVWGVIGRSNNGVLALADGVNWGDGARLAARCAIRGSIDHMNQRIENGRLDDTREVFHELLAAFHSAHTLILQEGGMLTTLCVAVVAPAKDSNSWVLCVCNVGDSLCFVYNRNYGVREVTLGSHDIDQMRDMRDAGGALGPVDGRNPHLQNLTCSMTFLDEGDVVFITSDGVSDNFDPVVGKFCVIKRSESENKENANLPPREPRKLSVSTRESPSREFARTTTCAASLPMVDAAQRHELMLVRMRDIIANGVDPPPNNVHASPRNEPLFPRVSASLLCHRLINFATLISQVRRRTLEDPELYKKEKMTKSEQRARRKAVREKIADLPGKLDHASVVAYRVARKGGVESPRTARMPRSETITSHTGSVPDLFQTEVSVKSHLENFQRQDKATCCTTFKLRADRAHATLRIRVPSVQDPLSLKLEFPLSEMVEPRSPDMEVPRSKSPYEQLPVTSRAPTQRKKHARGSTARHTLGVDVEWLSKLMGRKNSEEQNQLPTPTPLHATATESCALRTSESMSLRQRLRGFLGSKRNLPAESNRVVVNNDVARAQACDSARGAKKPPVYPR